MYLALTNVLQAILRPLHLRLFAWHFRRFLEQISLSEVPSRNVVDYSRDPLKVSYF